MKLRMDDVRKHCDGLADLSVKIGSGEATQEEKDIAFALLCQAVGVLLIAAVEKVG